MCTCILLNVCDILSPLEGSVSTSDQTSSATDTQQSDSSATTTPQPQMTVVQPVAHAGSGLPPTVGQDVTTGSLPPAAHTTSFQPIDVNTQVCTSQYIGYLFITMVRHYAL